MFTYQFSLFSKSKPLQK